MLSIAEILSQELGQKVQYVENVIALMDEGNTIPFIARYRKEVTGSLDDTTLRTLEDRLTYLRNIEKRKQEVKDLIAVLQKQYPDLKSNENYKQLMTELATTENLIASTRSNYNTWVSKYNSYVKKFPNRGILDMLGYEVQPFEKLNYDVSSDAPTDLFD